MNAVFPAEPDTCREDTRAGAQGNRDTEPGGNMAAIQHDKEEQVRDQAGSCDEDILSLQPFELDRAADSPMDRIDVRCHRFKFYSPKND